MELTNVVDLPQLSYEVWEIRGEMGHFEVHLIART